MSERESELGNKPAMTLEEIREICPPIVAMLVGLGMLKEAETDEVYCSSIMDLAAFNKAYTEDNLDLFKAIIALSMYTAAKDILGPTVFPEMEGNSDPFAFSHNYHVFCSRRLMFTTLFRKKESRNTISWWMISRKPCMSGLNRATGQVRKPRRKHLKSWTRWLQ